MRCLCDTFWNLHINLLFMIITDVLKPAKAKVESMKKSVLISTIQSKHDSDSSFPNF